MVRNITLIITLFLSSCMVGPDYKEPGKRVADHWLNTSAYRYASVTETPAKTENWWNIFYDPTLTALIKKGYQNNLTAQIAGVRILKARAQLAQAVGELYPQQQVLVGDYTYNRIGGGSLQNILPPDFLTSSLGFSANWEIDFWGKYRRAIQGNNASFLASIAAYDYALVTLVSDIASTYVGIRTYEALIKTTKSNIRLQAESLKIARSRFNAGQTSMLDVQQAQTELSQTKAKLPSYVNKLRQAKDKLAVLLGLAPCEVDKMVKPSYGIPKAPKRVEVGIPIETLAQRPDIFQSRLEAVAKSSAIGVAKANLFPALSLAGTFTFSGNNIGISSISDMFRWQNRAISAGPSITWPILNYGQITNEVRMYDAAFQEALLKYQNRVLLAQQEVQDNISSYIEAKNTVRDLNTANRSAVQSSKLALIRYKEGESSYTTVLDVERQQLQVQTSLIKAQGNISQAVVELYRSLGGGWQIRKGNDILPQHIKCEMASRTNWGNLLYKCNHIPPTSSGQRIAQLFLPNW